MMTPRLLAPEEIPALEDCLRQLADYHNQVSLHHRGSYPARPIARVLEEFSAAVAAGTSQIAVVEKDGRTAGFAKVDLHRDTGKLDYLLVCQPFRGQGLGKVLMDWAMEVFHAAGVRRVEVKVVAGNPAIHLYEKYGFRLNAYELWRTDGL